MSNLYATSASHAWHYIEQHMAWLCTAFPSSATLNRLRQNAENIRDAAVAKVQGCTVDACTKSHLKEVQQTHHKGQIMARPLHNRFEKAVTKPGVAIKESRNFMAKEEMSRGVERAIYTIRDNTAPTRYNHAVTQGKCCNSM